mgnify:CR=1 FL=1
MSGTLTVVGTPIGNLGDFSPRAREALAAADFIAAEDTRVTLKLLNHFGLKKPMLSYYEHNKRGRGAVICERIEAGENCVLVSDAGMPAISDPGEDLVAECAARGIRVLAVPGPTAMATALALSGLPTGRFTFEGFLSVNKKSRRDHLEELRGEKRTMVFYEAPHKLAATLRDLLDTLGDRRIALARELTKIHEEVIRTTLAEAANRFADGSARGEFVLVVEGAAQEAPAEAVTVEEAAALALSLAAEESLPLSEACRRAAAQTGLPRNRIYKAASAQHEASRP